MIKAIFFDLDGTLAYTLPDIMNNLNRVRAHKNLPPVGEDLIHKIINGTTQQVVKSVLPENMDDEYYNEAVDYYLKEYDIHFLDTTKAYPGVLEVIKQLKEKGYILCVLSNKDDDHTRIITQTLYGNDLFVEYLGPNNFPGKPNPESSRYLFKKYNLKPDEVVYVGDTDTDIKTANNAEMNLLCVSWGYRDYDFLINNGAKYIAKTPEEILLRIDEINKDIK